MLSSNQDYYQIRIHVSIKTYEITFFIQPITSINGNEWKYIIECDKTG
jgi:hypothetical protein